MTILVKQNQKGGEPNMRVTMYFLLWFFLFILGADSVEARVIDVKSNYDKAYFIDDDNCLWGSGYVVYGNNVEHNGKEYITIPQIIAEDVKSFNFVSDINVILKNDGTLLTYGGEVETDKIAYTLGQGDITGNYTPTVVLTDVKTSSMIDGVTVVALKNDGTLWAWGNIACIIGGNSREFISEPICIMSGVEEIYEANNSLYVHKKDGEWLACCYEDIYLPPIEFNLSFEPKVMWSSSDVTFALDENNNLWGWGCYGSETEGKEHPLEKYTPVMIESNVKAAERIWGEMETDKDFIILKNDGTLLLKDASESEKIADNIKGFRRYRYFYNPNDDPVGESKNDYMYLDYNGDLFFMPDYKTGERELILTDVRDFVSDQFDYAYEHMFVEKNDDSLWVMGYSQGGLGTGKHMRDVEIPMQNLYNVETTSETTTEITTESITEAPKKIITESKTLYVLSAIAVFGGVMFCIFKVRKKE